MSRTFAQVALPRPVEDIFHYSVPQQLNGQVGAGSVVQVPFGKRTFTGVVTALVDKSPVPTRDILALREMTPLPPDLLDLTRWVSSYYMSPLGMLTRLALPPAGPGAGVKFRLTERGQEGSADIGGGVADLLQALGKGARTARYLEERFSAAALEEAVGSGLLEAVESDSRQPERSGEVYRREEEPVSELTPHQQSALGQVEEAIAGERFEVTLLEGVTGSGKTEVYIRAARTALAAGKGVLFLVPEIGLTPLLTSRLERMAPGQVCLLHSGMTGAERRSSWKRMTGASGSLVVGVRSAVFAPVPRLGLIVVDEEHDSSYRQEETPSYNARDVAVKRSQMLSIPVILGSATPSVESHHNAEAGRYHLARLPERVTPAPEPEMVLVDMSAAGERDPEHPFLSRRLTKELAANLKAGQQSMIFLNRRGFSPFILCEECGETGACPNCSVTLTFHKGRGLLCHYCGHRQQPPDTCPSCGGISIGPVGTGTQKLEDTVRELYPEAVVERLDRDIITGRGRLEDLLKRMDSGEIQILVGTQLLAKGHDFPGVTLAGIISAEQALDLPDFRSAERTFQIITQVAGRAGRGEMPGRVVVQTYTPGHYAVESALAGDYESFYRHETETRRALGYPPFGRMGRVIVEGVSQEKVAAAMERLAARLPRTGDGVRVLGPSPAPLMKIRSRHRWHLLVLAPTPSSLHAVLSGARHQPPPGVRVHVRVDPYQLL